METHESRKEAEVWTRFNLQGRVGEVKLRETKQDGRRRKVREGVCLFFRFWRESVASGGAGLTVSTTIGLKLI